MFGEGLFHRRVLGSAIFAAALVAEAACTDTQPGKLGTDASASGASNDGGTRPGNGGMHSSRDAALDAAPGARRGSGGAAGMPSSPEAAPPARDSSAGTGGVAPGDSPDADVDAGAPPSPVTVLYPPRHAYTDANAIGVRGVVHGSTAIRALSVGGVAASTQDGFAHWTVRVPTPDGCSTFPVSITDALGNTDDNAGLVDVCNHGFALADTKALEFDADHNRLLAIGSAPHSLIAVSLSTGRATSLLNPRSTGDYEAEALALDVAHNRVLFPDSDSLDAVDLEDGTRSVVAGAANDPSLTVRFGVGLALTPDGATVYVLNIIPPSVVAIDLASGSRQLVTDASHGSGPALTETGDIVYDAVSNPQSPRLLVSNSDLHAILSVDLTTGNRTTWTSAAPNGTGEVLVAPGRMRIDAKNHRLLVVDGESADPLPATNAKLFGVDLASGNRTVIADDQTGSGPPLFRGRALAYDPKTSSAYVAGSRTGEIVQVSLGDGARHLVANSDAGAGDRIASPAALAFYEKALWVSDFAAKSLVRIGARTSERVTVSGPNVGSGPTVAAGAFVIDAVTTSRPRALMMDLATDSLYAADLATGRRKAVSLSNLAPQSWTTFPGMVLDAARNRVLFAYQSVIDAFDLTTGARTNFAKNFNSGSVQNIVLDDVTDPPRVLALGSNSVMTVGLATAGTGSLVTYNTSVQLAEGAIDHVNKALIATSYPSDLVSIDLGTGEITPIRGGGPIADLATAVAVDSEARVAYVVDNGRSAILAVDLDTGQRVITAR